MLGLGVPGALAVLGAISAAHHGRATFLGQSHVKRPSWQATRGQRRNSTEEGKNLTMRNWGYTCTYSHIRFRSLV